MLIKGFEDDIPKRTRKTTSPVAALPEWPALRKLVLDRGLSPKEFSGITLTAKLMRDHGIKSANSVGRFFRRFLDGADLAAEYQVRVFTPKGAKDPAAVIQRRPVKPSATKSKGRKPTP